MTTTWLQLPYISSNSLKKTQVTRPSIGHCHWVQTWLRSLSFCWDVFGLGASFAVKNIEVSLTGFFWNVFLSFCVNQYLYVLKTWNSVEEVVQNAWIAGFLMVAIFMGLHHQISVMFNQSKWLSNHVTGGPTKLIVKRSISHLYNQLPFITNTNEFQISVSHNIEYHHTTQPPIYQFLRCVSKPGGKFDSLSPCYLTANAPEKWGRNPF